MRCRIQSRDSNIESSTSVAYRVAVAVEALGLKKAAVKSTFLTLASTTQLCVA